jgi:hypothetical protein
MDAESRWSKRLELPWFQSFRDEKRNQDRQRWGMDRG